MNAHALRTILLVKAVEEQDVDGAILTPAERDAATREALRALPAVAADAPRGTQEARAWRVLAARADDLYSRLVVRHPVITHGITLEARAARATFLVLVAGFALGLLLSVLDSRVRIEILAFPLLGVVLWNFAVYLWLAVPALGRRVSGRTRDTGASALHWVNWPARWAWRRATALVKQAAFYHRPLAAALRRFADEWWPLAQPLLLWQGKRIFHLAAATVALGLVAGFYVRGIALEYRAGWESTFLGATEVRRALHALYGPAAAVSGTVLPADDAQVEALHWRDGAGGGPAATWIHLMAVTALLYVVVPRLVLALFATVGFARASRNLSPPDTLQAYARAVLGGSSASLPAVDVRVTPFAYEPGAAALDGLRRLLATAFGPETRIDLRGSVAYGDEAAMTRSASEGASSATPDVDVVLLNLAATPELENHGAALTAAHGRVVHGTVATRRVALIDESAFLVRMGQDAALAPRVEERRQAWREFVLRHGWAPYLVDLEAVARAPSIATELTDGLRRAGRGPGA